MTRSPTCSTSFHAGGWNVSVTAFFDVEDGGQVWVVTGTNGENRLRAKGATCAEAWRWVLDQAAVVEVCRVGLGRRGSRGRQGAWHCASEEGPGAVSSSANGGVLARGVGKEAMDPRAGRNRSGMVRTSRVRAPRVVAVCYTPPWPRASQSRGWVAERITHTCEYCTRDGHRC